MNQEVLDNFKAITGADDVSSMQYLEATGWDLGEACQLYFSSNDNSHDDEALARRIAQEGSSGTPATDGAPMSIPPEDGVRAADPTKVERLYGDVDPHARGRLHARTHSEAFRDFRQEQGNGSGEGGAAERQGLGMLYRPPLDVLHHGDFDSAKERAAGQNKWLLVNVQNPQEFASHQLNRDTWGYDMIQEIIKSSFIFWQRAHTDESAEKVMSFYHLTEDRLPITLVLDPITGAAVREWVGFVDPEKLMEELGDYLDRPPSDPGTAQLASKHQRRRLNMAGTSSAGHSFQERSGAAAAAAAAAESVDEDAELAMAIAASMEQHSDDAAAAAEAAGPSHAAPDPIAVQEEAARRMPEEPAEGDAAGCRMGLRLPDGSRLQRRFPRNATVQSLMDWVISHEQDAAAGKPFRLSEGLGPGTAVLADPAQTLANAGVAGAMIIMRWET